MMIKRNRGFKLGRKMIRIFKWVTRRRRRSSYRYHKIEGQSQSMPKNRALAKIYKWGRSIRHGFFSGKRAYIRVGQDPITNNTKSVQVPKGYLSVYVGDCEDETKKVLVPVLFLNHPLFSKLLKEAEDVYGFDYPGRIMIPCPISEFENVQTKIAAGVKCRPLIQNHTCVSGIKCL